MGIDIQSAKCRMIIVGQTTPPPTISRATAQRVGEGASPPAGGRPRGTLKGADMLRESKAQGIAGYTRMSMAEHKEWEEQNQLTAAPRGRVWDITDDIRLHAHIDQSGVQWWAATTVRSRDGECLAFLDCPLGTNLSVSGYVTSMGRRAVGNLLAIMRRNRIADDVRAA